MYQHKNMQFDNHNIFCKFQIAYIKQVITETDIEFCPGKTIELE